MFGIFGNRKRKAAAAQVYRPAREPSAPLLGDTSFIWRGQQNYPEITINQKHIAGLAEWLMKIMQKSAPTGGTDEPWNALIADLWPNDGMGRLIGHVQMNDVAIGYDTGFRVCAYVSGGGIVGGNQDEKADIPLFQSWLEAAVKSEPLRPRLRRRAEDNPFKIRLTFEGMGAVDNAIEIVF